MSRAVRRWPTAAALVVVGFRAGGGRATLYDGVRFPDDPYRYVGGVRTALTGLLPRWCRSRSVTCWHTTPPTCWSTAS
jgi:hypothetical protein